MRVIYPAIVVSFLVACGAGFSGEPDKHSLATNNYEVVIARVFFEFDAKRATLLDLHRAATDFLRKEYREFQDDYEKIVPDGGMSRA